MNLQHLFDLVHFIAKKFTFFKPGTHGKLSTFGILVVFLGIWNFRWRNWLHLRRRRREERSRRKREVVFSMSINIHECWDSWCTKASANGPASSITSFRVILRLGPGRRCSRQFWSLVCVHSKAMRRSGSLLEYKSLSFRLCRGERTSLIPVNFREIFTRWRRNLRPPAFLLLLLKLARFS